MVILIFALGALAQMTLAAKGPNAYVAAAAAAKIKTNSWMVEGPHDTCVCHCDPGYVPEYDSNGKIVACVRSTRGHCDDQVPYLSDADAQTYGSNSYCDICAHGGGECHQCTSINEHCNEADVLAQSIYCACPKCRRGQFCNIQATDVPGCKCGGGDGGDLRRCSYRSRTPFSPTTYQGHPIEPDCNNNPDPLPEGFSRWWCVPDDLNCVNPRAHCPNYIGFCVPTNQEFTNIAKLLEH